MYDYDKIRKRKEFECIKAIGERLEKKDIESLNPNYNGMYLDVNENGEQILTTGFIKKSYWFDIYYAFELLDWVRKNLISK